MGRSGARSIGVMASIALVLTALAFVVPEGRADSLGAAVQLSAAVHGDDAQLIDELESDIGRRLDAVRVFTLWGEAFPSTDDLALLDGRRMVLSIKPKVGSVKIPWADIAAAQPGDPLHDDMVQWAAAMAPYADQIYLTLHHEPEASSNLEHGVDVEFIAAWQRFMSVMDDEGLQTLGRVWIMTDYSFHVPPSDRRFAPKWYPGDAHVDAAAIDAYNWHHCRPGIFTRWMTLDEIIEPFREWGAARPGVELMLTEIGSVEDAATPGRKAAWIDDARALLQNGEHGQFTLASYFDLDDPNPGTNCDWRLDTSVSATGSFALLAQDPFFGGDGDPLPSTTTTTIAPEQSCAVSLDGSAATLSWIDEGGTHVIRRNGAWLATPGANTSSFVDDPSPAGATYELRIWNGGQSTYPCSETPPPSTTTTTTSTSTTSSTTSTSTTSTTSPPSQACTVARIGGDNILSWIDEGGTHVVRRDGSWLATPGENVNSYVDVGGPPTAAYELRIWQNGRADHPCTG